jgi:hypothetical protein
VIHEVVSLFHPGTNTSETLDLSTYGFLYGVFPAAPGVFVFATQYSLDVDLVSEFTHCYSVSLCILILCQSAGSSYWHYTVFCTVLHISGRTVT